MEIEIKGNGHVEMELEKVVREGWAEDCWQGNNLKKDYGKKVTGGKIDESRAEKGDRLMEADRIWAKERIADYWKKKEEELERKKKGFGKSKNGEQIELGLW